MSRTISQLDQAAEPVQGTDLVAISRDGNILTRVELSKLPISTAAQNAINNIVVLTPAQVAAGATSVVGITNDGVVLDKNGNPVKPYSRIVQLSSNYTLQATDMNVIFEATISVNITIPPGLTGISCIFYPPDNGSLTFTPGSGVTLNGGTTALTRSFANTAINLLPKSAENAFKLSGI